MRFNTYINNKKCLEWDITPTVGALFDLFNQMASWAESTFVEGHTYYSISKEKVIEELPLYFNKKDTVYRAIKILHEKDLIHWKKMNNRDLVSITRKGSSWNKTDISDIDPTLGFKSDPRIQIRPSDSDPSKLGFKSERIIDNNYNNIIIYNPPYIYSPPFNSEKIQKLFEEFWNAYPKDRAGSKEKAHLAFSSVILSEKIMPADLIEKARQYATCDEVKTGFSMICARWLEEERFNGTFSFKTFNLEQTQTEKKKQEEHNQQLLAEEEKQLQSNKERFIAINKYIIDAGFKDRVDLLKKSGLDEYNRLIKQFNEQYEKEKNTGINDTS